MASRQLIASLGVHGVELKRSALVPPWFTDPAGRGDGRAWWQDYLDNYMAGAVELEGAAGH